MGEPTKTEGKGGTSSFFDVRMRGFQQRTEVDAVLRLIAERVAPLATETVAVGEAADRVLAEDVVAPCPVPGFARAAMDDAEKKLRAI